MRVAVTRPVNQAGALSAALSAAGLEPVSVPLVVIGPPGDGGDSLAEALRRLDSFTWVVFTSVNAVEAFFAHASSREMPMLAAVGQATHDALTNHGAAVALTNRGRATAEELLARFPPGSGVVLFPSSNLSRPTIADGLANKGWTVEVVEAYRTVPLVPDTVATALLRKCDLVTLASPSACTALADAAHFSGVHVVTIGPTTTAAARRAGLVVVAEAEEQSDDGLVAAVMTAAHRT